MKKSLILFLTIHLAACVCAQRKNLPDTVIHLQDVSASAKRGLQILEPAAKKKNINTGIRGKSFMVSKVPVVKNAQYNIRALEFFFNYKWKNFEGEGFYIRPVILSSEQGKPGKDYFTTQHLYFVSKKIGDVIHIDMSEFDLQIKDVDSFFVGIEFVKTDGKSKLENFTVTMVPVRNSLDNSFTKNSCDDCKYSPADPRIEGISDGVSLKYKVYYTP